MTLKTTFKHVIRDRSFVLAGLLMALLLVLAIALELIYVRPSDFQLPNRYSAFGVTNIYRAGWYYAFNFLIFGFIIAVFNTLVSLKVFENKGRKLALSLMWLSCLILFITDLTILAILRLAALGQ